MANERQTYRNKARAESQRPRGRSVSGASASGSIGERIDSVLESLFNGKGSSGRRAPRGKGSRGQISADSFMTRFLSSKVAMVVTAAIVLMLVVVLWDNVANFGKAYGNVSINGESVAGMNAEQIRSKLEDEYGQKLSTGEVRIYASESAMSRESSDLAHQETVAQAEQVSVEDAKAAVTSWLTRASGLRASVPYDAIIQEALDAGRGEGPLGRLALFFVPHDVPLSIVVDDAALEELASAIDATIGDARTDSTVEIEDGAATAVRGHDGKMVDREWLKQKISEALMATDGETSFIAEVVDAPSRTTYEQAQQMSAAVNRALNSELQFRYRSQSWTADAVSIGSWTRVLVAQVDDGYELKAQVDSAQATSDLAKHLDASASGGNVIVDFEAADDAVSVKTSGSGIIPEVGPAVDEIQQVLYGDAGIAWSSGALASATIEVGESDAPEQLTFDQAVDLGVITVIGEYTTEFSNAEGTENRNHNIKLAADILTNSIAESGGGKWSFNEHSGDTNLDPPFASAGSIVDGEYVDSIGGGICQVATTIFNSVYEAGLPVDERRNHSLYIASYPTGRDAAVSYPDLDFVWSNPLESDVLLTLDYTDTTITAKLYSTPTGRRVTTETGEWEDGEKYKTTFETDEDLAEGSYYLKTTGSDGSQIAVVRTVYDIDGNVILEDNFTSVYSPKDEVYLIGPGTDTAPLIRTAGESQQSFDDEYSEPQEDPYSVEEYWEPEGEVDVPTYDEGASGDFVDEYDDGYSYDEGYEEGEDSYY